MQTITTNPHNAAQQHLLAAFEFYRAHGQEATAIAQLTAGLLAMSVQLQRIELHVMDATSC